MGKDRKRKDVYKNLNGEDGTSLVGGKKKSEVGWG